MSSRSILRRLAGLGRGMLRRLGSWPVGFRLLNLLSSPTCVYASFREARTASRRARPFSHQDRELIAADFELSLACRPSDYPALFWLLSLSRQGPLRVVDFGGGAGQAYYQYRPLLGNTAISEWTVVELPASIEFGRRLADKRGAEGLSFAEALTSGGEYDVLLAAGSIHYWEGPITELSSVLGRLPDHVIINRSPFRSERGSFITVQRGASWAVPCLVRNLG